MKNMAPSAETHTHTHTAPPRPVTKAPLARLGAGGMPWPRHKQPRYPRGCPYFYALNSPAPLVVFSVIMAANRQHLAPIRADLSWGKLGLRHRCGAFITCARVPAAWRSSPPAAAPRPALEYSAKSGRLFVSTTS